MARTCSVCTHGRLEEIDTALQRGASYREVHQAIDGLSIGSLHRHANNCLGIVERTPSSIVEHSNQIVEHRKSPKKRSTKIVERTRESLDARFSRLELSLASLHGRFDMLDAGLVEVWKYRDRIDANMEQLGRNFGELTGYWRALDVVLLSTLRQVQAALQSKPILPDEPAPTLIDPPDLDTEGMTPREAMGVCLKAMQQVWKQTPLRERPSMGRFVGEGLKEIASDEE
jgi:hypothetical protein